MTTETYATDSLTLESKIRYLGTGSYVLEAYIRSPWNSPVRISSSIIETAFEHETPYLFLDRELSQLTIACMNGHAVYQLDDPDWYGTYTGYLLRGERYDD